MCQKIVLVIFLVGVLVCSTNARSLAMENGAEEHTTYYRYPYNGGFGFRGVFGRNPGFGGIGGGSGLGGGNSGGGFGGNSGDGLGGAGSRTGSGPRTGSEVGNDRNNEGFDEGSAMSGKFGDGVKAGGGFEDGNH
ncbi:hypothetical protein LIER_15315 [Lithospermum erythrorhizon]|uniref:Glycine-rich protein n=1 Tax=Lithospermum erythrorhizon TaxID=34254 RepID=A0AAV3Q7N1_LITER